MTTLNTLDDLAAVIAERDALLLRVAELEQQLADRDASHGPCRVAASNRARVFEAVAAETGGLRLCQLVERLALSEPTVAKHLADLASEGLVAIGPGRRWHAVAVADARAA